MPRLLLIFSQSGYLFPTVAINLHTWWQTVQIQIRWLLQKPTDLDLHSLKNRMYPGSAGQGLRFLQMMYVMYHLFSGESRFQYTTRHSNQLRQSNERHVQVSSKTYSTFNGERSISKISRVRNILTNSATVQSLWFRIDWCNVYSEEDVKEEYLTIILG